MPLKVLVGFSQKVGQPDFGSIGASCQLECEMDSTLLERDFEQFQRRVRDAYIACGQAVHDELARHQSGQQSGSHWQTRSSDGSPSHGNGNGNGCASPDRNGSHAVNGRSQFRGKLATQSQARAIRAIAQRQGVDLVGLLRNRFQVERPDDLSIRDASELIDELKSQVQEDRR